MNEGCIPTKTLLRSAEVMHLVRDRAHEFGVRGIDPEKVWLDLTAVVARKDGIVKGIVDGIYGWVKPNPNVTFIRGRAEFTSPVDVRVDGKTITAPKTIIAAGSRTADAHLPGLTEVGFITNREALMLDAVPSSLIIIGGGFIGVEFAQMYARFGTKVTLLSRSPRLMKQEEPELSDRLAQILTAEGIDVRLGAAAKWVERAGSDKVVIAEIEGQEYRFQAAEILYAAGRVPRVDGLGLTEAGVEVGTQGIVVNEQLRTTAANIWSLGDVNGGAMFTHRATYDGPIAALNAVKDAGRTVDYRVVPRAVFTQPALASVGLTEAAATAAGHEVKTGVAYFAHSGRAKAIGETEGMIKLVADAQTGELLGGHILGPHADILIHEVVAAMYDRGTAVSLQKSIHIHPTLSEMVKDAAKKLR
ncbi:MAG: dihydrolipoamide dehydrogenase [Chloroflexi bacterium]|nr:MAG: dihydrolipoamide dehydrogenase [Chloroflexota bacterium]